MITYNAQGTELPHIDQAKVSEWVKTVAMTYGKYAGDINYIFVDDEGILDINRKFLGHDYYTDHIGFDYSTGNSIAGDIFISVDTIASNAELFGCTYDEELHRVIIHGVLHLCGIEDKEPGQRELMEQEENKALEIWKTLI